MSQDEYFHVFESILYAAIVTQIFSGWCRMIIDAGNYKFYWAHFLFSVNLLLIIIRRYMSLSELWHYEYITNTASFLFLIVLGPGLYFMSTYLTFPQKMSGVDFRQLLMERRGVIFTCGIFFLLFSAYLNVNHMGWTFIAFVPHVVTSVVYIFLIALHSHRLLEVVCTLNFLTGVYYVIV